MANIVMRLAGLKAGRTRRGEAAPAWLTAALKARQPVRKIGFDAVKLVRELAEVDVAAAMAAIEAGLEAGEFSLEAVKAAGLGELVPNADAPASPAKARK
jgi:hypothetical protein